ncbi:MAG: hypothetical protein POELPBGB_03622 [Bacteroidia bacterium]|nr:hypothetical protein [Bacteroidia bacterium]
MFTLLLSTTHSFSQLILSVGSSAKTSLMQEDLWQLNIKNPTALKYDNAKLSFQLSNEKKENILSSEAIILLINNGENITNSSSLFNVVYKNTKDSSNSSASLGKGLYEVCYKILSNSNTILSEQCFPVTVTGEDTLKKKKGIFKVYGMGTLTRFDSFGTDSRPANPANYTQAMGTLGVSLFDIPANVSFAVNQTGNSFDLSNSRISFGFDAQAVKQSLTHKAKEKLLKEQSNLDFGLLSNKNSLAELNSLNDILNNEQVVKELAQIAELDSIEQLLKDTTLQSVTNIFKSKKDSLGNKAEAKWDSSGVKSVTDSLTALKDTALVLKDSIMELKSEVKDSLETLVDLAYDTKDVVTDSLNDLKNVDSYVQLLERYEELKFIKEKKESYDKLIARKKELEKRVDDAKETIGDAKGYMSEAEQIYNDPMSVRKYIEQSEYFKPIEKILYNIKTLRIGNLMPQFSEFTLSNIPMNGFQIEITPFNTYEGFITGKVATPSGFLNQPAGERKLNAFGVGYGQNENSHLHVYYLKSNDKDNPADTAYKPQLNQVLSLSGKIDVLKEYLSINTEIAGSETVNDKRLAAINDANTDNGNFFSSVFSQETNDMNKAVGYALSTAAIVTAFKKKTEVALGFKKISAAYRTHGNPLLINNNTMLELKASQSLLKNRITLGGLVQRTIASPDNPTTPSMKLYQYGAELGLNFEKFPTLRVSYQPLMQSLDTIQIRTNILNANLSYSFRTGKIRHQSNLNYLKQLQTGIGTIFSSAITALHSVIFKDNSLISLQYGYYENSLSGVKTFNHVTDLSYSSVFFKKLTSTLAVSLNSGNSERKIGGRLELGYPLGKYLVFGIRGERNVYNNYMQTAYALNNYQEWVLRTWLNFKF